MGKTDKTVKRDQPWSSKGPAAQAILRSLEDGTLNPFTTTPGIVLEIYPEYIKFKKHSFDSGVRNLCSIAKNELQKKDSKRYQELKGEHVAMQFCDIIETTCMYCVVCFYGSTF